MNRAGDTAVTPPPSVFISYASEDREVARRLRDVLSAAGLEVWYDENELAGGDAWDQKIRRQIRECDFFMPVISARTEARAEGYFRREWRLAVERTLDMADDHLFLLPVVIDGTDQATARVPDRFLTVQWLRVPEGRSTAALESLCRRMLSGPAGTVPPVKSARAAKQLPGVAADPLPEFPRQEPGQRIRFGFHVAGWLIASGRIQWRRVPRWIRVIVYIWLIITGLSECRSCKSAKSPEVKASVAKAISDAASKDTDSSDAKVGLRIAESIARAAEGDSPHPAILAVPFSSAAGDAAGFKLADVAFALVYGLLATAHRAQVGLSDSPLGTLDPAAARERGRGAHARYVVVGLVSADPAGERLSVEIVDVKTGAVLWRRDFSGGVPEALSVATFVDAAIPKIPAGDPDYDEGQDSPGK